MPWLRAGIEGAVHAMRELYDEHREDGWGVILVDVNNVFNSLNRSVALQNVGPDAHVSYLTPEVIRSKEGVAQGDPLSMLMYAVALMPLILVNILQIRASGSRTGMLTIQPALQNFQT